MLPSSRSKLSKSCKSTVHLFSSGGGTDCTHRKYILGGMGEWFWLNTCTSCQDYETTPRDIIWSCWRIDFPTRSLVFFPYSGGARTKAGRPRIPSKSLGKGSLNLAMWPCHLGSLTFPAFCPSWLDCFFVGCRCGATSQRKELVEEKADPEPVMAWVARKG